MMTATIYNSETGESRTMPQSDAEHLIRQQPVWSFTAPLPKDWDREIPRYRAQFDLEPAALPRYLHENPFAFESSPRSYQYSAKKITAGEVIETTSWPHVSFIPLNENARRVHAFFTAEMKSRMQRSPWRDGRLNLDNGMSGNLFVSLAPIKPERVDLRAGGR